MVSRIFGRAKAEPKKPEEPAPKLDDVIGKTDQRGHALEQKIRECNQQLLGHKRAIKAAKTPGAKRTAKQRAMQVLKRKKMYEKQLTQIQGMQFNMERIGFAIETAQSTRDQVAAMKGASTSLKQQMEEMDLDDLEDMADDLNDMLADADEVQDVLGQSFALDDGLDDADLDEELEALEAEGLGDLDAELEGLEGESTGYYGYGAPTAATGGGMDAMPVPGREHPKPLEEGGERVDEFGAPILS